MGRIYRTEERILAQSNLRRIQAEAGRLINQQRGKDKSLPVDKIKKILDLLKKAVPGSPDILLTYEIQLVAGWLSPTTNKPEMTTLIIDVEELRELRDAMGTALQSFKNDLLLPSVTTNYDFDITYG